MTWLFQNLKGGNKGQKLKLKLKIICLKPKSSFHWFLIPENSVYEKTIQSQQEGSSGISTSSKAG